MDSKDLIKQKLNIVDVVGEYLTLRKAGTSYKGICPFHGEKTPSFMVNEERQRFHCFGCNEDGDIFTFIQKIENFDFPEALEFLANKAGVTLERVDQKKKSEKRGLTEVNALAAKFYHQVLVTAPQAKAALSYLHERGLTDETLSTWSIGFAPDSWDTLLKALKTKGISEQMMVTVGLVVQKEGGKVYDRFRKRIMFPIADVRGQVVGFTSRVIDKADEQFGGKYVNTPQTPLYNKSEVLFGLDKAKETIKKTGYAVMVEGNMDVIMSHQQGVTSAIATSGTALTADHLKQLKRYTDKIHFCFDSDAAGQQALLRAFHIAQQEEFDSYVVVLPAEVNGKPIKDPDDLARTSPESWKKAVEHPIPVMDYVFDMLPEKFSLGTDTGKKDAIKFIVPMILNYPSKVQQDHWLEKAVQRLSISESSLAEAVTAIKKKEKNVPAKPVFANPAPPKATFDRATSLGEHLFSMLMAWPEFIKEIESKFDLLHVQNGELADLYKALFSYYNQANEFNYSQFFNLLEAESALGQKASYLSFAFAEQNDAISPEHRRKEIDRVVSTIEYLHNKQELQRLQMDLASAESKGDRQKVESLMAEISRYNHLINQHHHGS